MKCYDEGLGCLKTSGTVTFPLEPLPTNSCRTIAPTFQERREKRQKEFPHQESQVQKMRRRFVGTDESRQLKRVGNQTKFAASRYQRKGSRANTVTS